MNSNAIVFLRSCAWSRPVQNSRVERRARPLPFWVEFPLGVFSLALFIPLLWSLAILLGN
jgi:hypothetical protein